MEVSAKFDVDPLRGMLFPFQTSASSMLLTPFFEFFSSALFFSSSETKDFARTVVYEEPSVPSLVRMILGSFGLSKSDLAKILGITRPALYAWLDGKSEPNVENIKRLKAMYDIIKEWPDTRKQPLFHAYIERPVAGNTQSLIEMLSASSIEVEKVRTIICVIQSMTSERDARIGKNRTKAASAKPFEGEQEQLLEDNLMAIETEE